MVYRPLTKEQVLQDEKLLNMCIQAWNTRSYENHKKYLRRKQQQEIKEEDLKQEEEIKIKIIKK